MLQQTRVATVRRYFSPFIERFPTPESLAQAAVGDLLGAWRGLGYYRRARALQAAAQMISRDWVGKFPATADELIRLPGVGAYTSRSVAAIAFGQPVLPIDGNIARVVARLTGQRHARRTLSAAADRRWGRALSTVDAGGAVQALMEIGSTICLPSRPDCRSCPWFALCAAAATPTPASYGVSAKRPPARLEFWQAVARFDDRQRLLLVYRPAGLLSGQWALPLLAREKREESHASGAGESHHTFTHRIWHTQIQIIANSDTSMATAQIIGDLPWHWCSDPRRCVTSRAFAKMLSQIARQHHLPDSPCSQG